MLSYSTWKLFTPLDGVYLPHLIHLDVDEREKRFTMYEYSKIFWHSDKKTKWSNEGFSRLESLVKPLRIKGFLKPWQNKKGKTFFGMLQFLKLPPSISHFVFWRQNNIFGSSYQACVSSCFVRALVGRQISWKSYLLNTFILDNLSLMSFLTYNFLDYESWSKAHDFTVFLQYI